jgi:NAD-dependent dihydropyrimidine dehydrogenase PreA subunit
MTMENIYYKLAKFLDAMPNGFPATESGIEIDILKKIFTEEDASVLMHLKMVFESAEQISKRTGLDCEFLKMKLPEMTDNGQIMGIRVGNFQIYRAAPFIFGIYEFQMKRMDKELAELCEKYDREAFGSIFFSENPPLMKTIPVGIEFSDDTTIEPYESITSMIEGSKSWSVRECVCKKEKSLLDRKCSKPTEVCLSFAPVENAFEHDSAARAITKEEAYSILKKCEEAGLVHMTSNYKSGHFYICNCCSCCCGPLSKYIAVSKNAAAKSNYKAVINIEECINCGVCADRCQAGAVEMKEYPVITDCIGCGLCVSTCPSGAIKLVRRDKQDIPHVPKNEREWMEIRARERGLLDEYKKLL